MDSTRIITSLSSIFDLSNGFISGSFHRDGDSMPITGEFVFRFRQGDGIQQEASVFREFLIKDALNEVKKFNSQVAEHQNFTGSRKRKENAESGEEQRDRRRMKN